MDGAGQDMPVPLFAPAPIAGSDVDLDTGAWDDFFSPDNFLMSGYDVVPDTLTHTHTQPQMAPARTGTQLQAPAALAHMAAGLTGAQGVGGLSDNSPMLLPGLITPSPMAEMVPAARPGTHTHTHTRAHTSTHMGAPGHAGAAAHAPVGGAVGHAGRAAASDAEGPRKRGRMAGAASDASADTYSDAHTDAQQEAPQGRVRRQAARAASARLSAALETNRGRASDHTDGEDDDEEGRRRGRKRGTRPNSPTSIMAAPRNRFSATAADIMAAAAAEAHAKVMALDAAGVLPHDDEDDEDDDDMPGRGKSDDRTSRRFVSMPVAYTACTTARQHYFHFCSRERNRIHARKSRLRKKYFVDSLKASLDNLERENRRLRAIVETKLGKPAESLLQEAGADPHIVAIAESLPTPAPSGAATALEAPGAAKTRASVIASPGQQPTSVLERGDYALVEALSKSQQNFVVSDPNLPDNPVVFASAGFYELTGYTPEEVLGRNCRFLQGPQTDPDTISVIRKGVVEGRDTAVCLLNYRKDGRPFWNSFFVAPLRGVDGRIVNFVGVQCEVSDSVAQKLIAAQKQAQAKLLGQQNAASAAVVGAPAGQQAPLHIARVDGAPGTMHPEPSAAVYAPQAQGGRTGGNVRLI